MARNKIYIPTFISSVNYAPARVLPHIYFYNGMKACETYYIQGYGNTTGSVVSREVDAFPYFDNYEGQDPTSGSRSLLFFNEPAVYGTTPTGSLYTNYWETYINLLYNPRTRLFNCEAIIPLADYFKMELNDIVEWRGNYYHLRAINDYNLSNGECKLQLLGPILGDIIPQILPAIACDFNFEFGCPPPTTTRPPSTTTTTTIAPTTSTTTGAPTTTTTTLAPGCNCQTITFVNNHTRLAGVLDYTPCGTSTQIREFVGTRSSQTRCVALDYPFEYPCCTADFQIIYGSSCTVPACAPTTTTTTTAAPTTSTTAAPTTTTTAAPTTTTTAAPTTTTTLAPSNVWRAVGCCDSASYYVGWTYVGPAQDATFYNPVVGTCMTGVENVASQSVSFSITPSNFNTYVYGYPSGGDQCSRCISLQPAPCPPTTTTTAAPTTSTTAAPTTTVAPTTSTTLSPTTTAAPLPLQKYRLTGNSSPSSTAGIFVDFKGVTQQIERYTFGTDYEFIALSGSVSSSAMFGLTILEASASYPTFNTVTFNKSTPGLAGFTGQSEDGSLIFYANTNPGWSYVGCFVSGTAKITYNPLGNLSRVIGGACIPSPTTTSTTAAPTTTTTLVPTTTTLSPTTTLAPTTTTTTISGSCSTYQITNSSPSLAGQVSYVPCGYAGYRDIFVPQSSTITLCVMNNQITNVSGYASSSLTDLGTPCTASLQDCINYTITNSGASQYDYSGKSCSNCANQLYTINGGVTVTRCFVSGTFSTSYPAFVTATAGAICNVSGSGCPI